MLLIIDNYDSFTHNLYQAFAIHYPEIMIIKNDQMSVQEIAQLKPKAIVISPGPGRPEVAGICMDLILQLGPSTPILGVCLGHQAIALAFGAQINQSREIIHGKECLIFHNRQNLFKEMPLPFKAGRYHSLLVENLPGELNVDGESPDSLIMAISHKKYPIYGVQFHPESILTPDGDKIVQNFVGLFK